MSRPPLWRLAPWTRAPLLGLRQPAAVLAVLVTSAILACAAASAPLFLSSARSAALQQQLAQGCAEVGWGQIGVDSGPPVSQAADADLAAAWAAEGRVSVPALAFARIGTSDVAPGALPVVDARGEPLSLPAGLLYRPGAAENIEVVDSVDGAGVWVPQTYAEASGLAPGDEVEVAGVPVRVVGVYTDLFRVPESTYWCDYRQLYANDASGNTAPPALLLATDEATFYAVTAGTGAARLAQVPVAADELSVTDARELLAAQARAQGRVPTPPPATGAFVPNERLPGVVARAELIEAGLRGPVVPVAVAGGLLALVLVAAAGSFWADRRATEVRLLAARGVGPLPLAGKAALELALPALAGAALGWTVARGLIAVLGPADDLDPAATTAALWAGAAAFVVGLGCAAGVAGLRARGTAERPLGAAARWPSRVPWELALLVAAGWCWVLLRGQDAVRQDAGVAQVNGLLVAFPLLAIAGSAVLLARLLSALLPRLRRWAGRRSPAVFLAVNRLAAARLATATLLVAVTLPVAVLGYTATLTESSQTTLDAKVGVQIGTTGRAVTSVSRFDPTPAIDAVGTYVVRYGDGSVPAPAGQDGDSAGRVDVQVLAVDPDTFARTAFWDDSFADAPLPELLEALRGPDVDGRPPVVAAGLAPGPADLELGSLAVPVQVVAEARVLPGRRTADPVLLVDASRLPDVDRSARADRTAEIWTEGPTAPAVEALTAAGGVPLRVVDQALVLNTANFLGITWTFGYLSALAVFVGVIAAGGLLLYLEARSRSRVSGYVMARRLGLTRAAHLRSLLLELGGVAVAGLVLGTLLAAGAVAVVYRRLDVDLIRPPTPLLDVPWTAGLVTAVLALVLAGLAALYAQHAADRADPASVLREDA
ncbi:FtsX-like permease family protein [Modestobacter sp. I12A-02628]|uniref:FtsX-like permease family protein n=1 Tax=Goekera deserti TaxID=2497753 RepID=A0A7K3WJF6_9ACTN|nr:FtsX-like permease family protein [Goekera deserti]MPQ99317.1 FtsX-like permease family protein [Goekera deserti]NDI50316.1 hypothetical protein [Goekera deserti]NEL56432.1 FtsX-like permease family protein [Goekera deserti]